MVTNPRKRTSLRESLAGSQAYNPIRNSRRDFLSQKVSPRVSDRIICMTFSETLSETRFFLRGKPSYDSSINCNHEIDLFEWGFALLLLAAGCQICKLKNFLEKK